MSKFTTSWDETKPAGGRSKTLGDDDIREFKQQFRERLGEDHYTLQTESDDALVGFHKKVTLLEQASDPASLADAFYLYAKLQGSYSELFGRHENAGVQRLTNLGKLWINALGIDSAARGDLIVRGASLFDRLALGASGTFLKSDGTDATWAALSVLFSELPNGTVIQDYYKEFPTRVAGGTTVMPLDNSIGTTSEGHEFMVADAFTPLSASSKIYVEFEFLGELSANETICGGIFYDAVANAVKMGSVGSVTRGVLTVKTRIDSWGLSARTFKFRAGATGGGAGLDMNGYTTQLFGGVACSCVRIWEVKA